MCENGEENQKRQTPLLVSPPVDPLRNLASSENYIQSLEEKIRKIKGGGREPTSQDILQSLEMARSDQMVHLLLGEQHTSTEVDYTGSVVSKTYKGKEQSVEEVVALLYQDELSKTHSDSANSDSQRQQKDDGGKTVSGVSG